MLLCLLSPWWIRQCLLAPTFCSISRTLESYWFLGHCVLFFLLTVNMWEMLWFLFFLFFLSFGFLPHTSLAVRIWTEFCLFCSCKYFIKKHGLASEQKLQPGLPRVLCSLMSIICCVCAGARLTLPHLLGPGVRGRPWAAVFHWGVCDAVLHCSMALFRIQWDTAKVMDLNPASPCSEKFVLHGGLFSVQALVL